MIVPIILSGGSGRRLWPLSRKQYPKQYLPLASENTMLQETILRLDGIDNISDPIIVCNAEHRFLVAEQCQQINLKNPIILLEPIGRNTAPAIAAAALQALKISKKTTLLVLSADHIIHDIDAFHRSINISIEQVEDGKLVTFGIVPTEANTGYGYIKLSKKGLNGAYEVEKFIEKPDFKTAKYYVDNGNYLWNSGMFIFKACKLIDELNEFSPEIISSVKNAINKAKYDLDFIRLDKESFEESPSDSIDYALMEKSNNVVVVPLDANWNDVGSWSVLYDVGKKDECLNVINGDVIALDTFNSYINATHHIVATIGVDNLIIVDTPDATFIASKDKAKDVEKIVDLLQASERIEFGQNRKVFRPWGWYDSIESGDFFQVKRLHVSPGAKLSLQKHHKRAEHWVVIKGEAKITCNDMKKTLKKGESVYIPLGAIHSLENITDNPLEIIEVQSGTYLGEDDIIRFEDIYGRE
jgi:mannose-1-phosphate guanylyltransferase / mannose-6-phosphate isomerase